MKSKKLFILTCFFCFLFLSLSVSASALEWPVPGHTSLSRGFGNGHDGIDISDGSINGASVVASMSGTVYKIFLCSHNTYPNTPDCCYGFGTGLVIKGDDGRYYSYAHMQSGSIPSDVYYGSYVSAGKVIGKVGSTGCSTGPHLHFKITNSSSWWQSSAAIDPYSFSYSGSSSPNPVPGDGITWTKYNPDLTETNAVVKARVVPPSRVYVQWAGCNFFDANGREIAKAGETVGYNASYLNMTWNVNQETWSHYSLQPGTTYKYQFYVTWGNVDHFSPMYSFTTPSHSYRESVTMAATCSSTGIMTYTCACGSTYTKEIAKKSHTWDAGTVKVSATATRDGIKEYKCNVCAAVRSEIIKSTGAILEPAKAGAILQVSSAEYKVCADRKSVEYCKYKKNAKSVTIPSTIKVNGITYKVVGISENAFKNNNTVTEVTIGANVTYIKKYAFYKCKNLKKIIVKTKLLKAGKIGAKAFSGISAKATIAVPKSKYFYYVLTVFGSKVGTKQSMISFY